MENFSNFPWKTERKVLGGEAREEVAIANQRK